MGFIRTIFLLFLLLQPGISLAESNCQDVYQDLLATLKQEQDFISRFPGNSYHDEQHLNELIEELDAYARQVIQCFIDRNSDAINQVIGHINMIASIIEYAKANPEQFQDTLASIFQQYYDELIRLLEDAIEQPDDSPDQAPGGVRAI
jgi:hypothetical protein